MKISADPFIVFFPVAYTIYAFCGCLVALAIKFCSLAVNICSIIIALFIWHRNMKSVQLHGSDKARLQRGVQMDA